MEILDRVNEIIISKKLNPRSFAKTINFNYSTLNNYLIGRRKTIDSILLLNILSTYDDLSAEWLLRGTGEMYKSDDSYIEQLQKKIDRLQIENNILKKVVRIQDDDDEDKKMKDVG